MNILFHIGAAKTASTSIQSFLSSNKIPLSKIGLFYPTSDRLKHSEFAFAASYDINDSIDVYQRYIPKELLKESDIFKYFQTRIKYYLEDFKRSGCHTLILSDEILPYRCNTVDKLESLKSLFPEGSEFQFIYYKRLASEMYISLYSTLLKVGQTKISPFDFSIPQDYSNESNWIASREMFNHNNLINNLSKVFGVKSLTVFDYDFLTRLFPNQSIVEHFLYSTNIEINIETRKPSNPRLDYIGLYILYLYNYLLDYVSDLKPISSWLELMRHSTLIPILEFIAIYSPFKFPNKYVICNRDLFDKLFD